MKCTHSFQSSGFHKSQPRKERNHRQIGFACQFYSETVHFSGSGKSRKMVHDQYQVMGLVIPPKLILIDPNVYSHCHVYSSLARSGQWSGNEIVLPVTANLNFWSRAIFWNLALPEKCTDPERKCMRTSECAYAPEVPSHKPDSVTSVRLHYDSGKPHTQICHLFNNKAGNICRFNPCRFGHVCIVCRGSHPASQCRSRPPPPKFRRSDSPAGKGRK